MDAGRSVGTHGRMLDFDDYETEWEMVGIKHQICRVLESLAIGTSTRFAKRGSVWEKKFDTGNGYQNREINLRNSEISQLLEFSMEVGGTK